MRTESVTAAMRTNSVTFATRPRTAVEQRPRKASSYRDASGCSRHQFLSGRAAMAAKFVTFSLHLASGCDLFSPRRQGDHGLDPGVSPSTRPSLRSGSRAAGQVPLAADLRIQHSQALHAAAAQPLAKSRSPRARAGCARRWRVSPPSCLLQQVVHWGAARPLAPRRTTRTHTSSTTTRPRTTTASGSALRSRLRTPTMTPRRRSTSWTPSLVQDAQAPTSSTPRNRLAVPSRHGLRQRGPPPESRR